MAQPAIQQTFELALQNHRAGRLQEAEQLYREILAQEPNHAEALHFLGVIAGQFGRNEIAVDLIGRSVALNPNSPEAHCDLGNALKEGGRLDEAIAASRKAIALNPKYPEAHNNLGNALSAKGQLDEAIAAYRNAIALKSSYPLAYLNLGNALKNGGQLDEAIVSYRQAVALKADFTEAHYSIGTALRDKGQLDEAITAYHRAIALKPNFPAAYIKLGTTLREKGQLDEAIAACRQAIALKPSYPETHNALGNALSAKGQFHEAIAAYRQAIALKSSYPLAYLNLGNALKTGGQLDEAIASYRQAVALKPNFPAAYSNLGVALKEKGHMDEAVAACRQAIALNPKYPEAHNNLGDALSKKGQIDEAIAACRRAIALKPDLPEAHKNLALILLLAGNFAEGWKEYEWRWHVSKELGSVRWSFPQAQWDGSDLAHRTIYLHAEQGLGDTIQFIRYVPMVAGRGAKIVVRCRPELRRLLQPVSGVAQWILPGEPLPPFDVHCPLLSLPLVFGTTLETIPQAVPYLRANSEEGECWRERLAQDHRGLNVGLAWAGSSKNTNDHNRSIPLSLLAPLTQVKGVNFHSLQKDETGMQARNPPAGLELIDRTEGLKDFADTAALIANLDLVISVDTAVAHLAGAMGKPVWVMLPFAPDWRWLLDREDSPWYPTMRLFRQRNFGAWNSVIQQVSESLLSFIHHR